MPDKPLILSLPEPRTLELIFTPEKLRELRDSYRIIEGRPGEETAVLESHISEADFVIGQPPLPTALIERARRLKAIFNVEGNFLDNMDYEACFERGIHVLTTSRVFAMPVAEIGLGMALCLLRDICVADRAFRTGNELWGFDGNRNARLLSESDIGFIGFGDLGQALHGLVKGFGAPVRVFDPWLPDSYLAGFGVEPASLETVLGNSDI
ncbi:MAG TPA: hydroxyacid dehydrogenase, partial [Rhodobacteraceae bacterium]|nr:hydroxyacid dehydrogenase [Paracoccaceae bacterium]